MRKRPWPARRPSRSRPMGIMALPTPRSNGPWAIWGHRMSVGSTSAGVPAKLMHRNFPPLADPPTEDNPGSRPDRASRIGVDYSGGHPDRASASGRLHESETSAMNVLMPVADGSEAVSYTH